MPFLSRAIRPLQKHSELAFSPADRPNLKNSVFTESIVDYSLSGINHRFSSSFVFAISRALLTGSSKGMRGLVTNLKGSDPAAAIC